MHGWIGKAKFNNQFDGAPRRIMKLTTERSLGIKYANLGLWSKIGKRAPDGKYTLGIMRPRTLKINNPRENIASHFFWMVYSVLGLGILCENIIEKGIVRIVEALETRYCY